MVPHRPQTYYNNQTSIHTVGASYSVQAERAGKALPVVDRAQASAADKTSCSGLLSEAVRERKAEVGGSEKARVAQARATTRKLRLVTYYHR